MAQRWWFVEADTEERRRFGGMQEVLSLPAPLAAPRNRLREVRRLQAGTATWFLKVFHRTQPKNRLRNLWTAPRGGSDAEREAAMATALRRAGIAAPRPVAVGVAGARSVFLCAALPGRSLRELLVAGAADRRVFYRAAAFCGEVLRRGFCLPDLSAEHVFVLPGGGFGLIDLHNGGLRRPGRPGDRLLVRVLRHFARSVQGLGVARRPGLRFAVQLLRAAGAGDRARRLLARVPPLDPAARYEVQGRVERYRQRNPERTAAELRLLARVWPGEPGDLVLDCPCGTGRLWPLLRSELGARVLAADGALAMLAAAGGERFSIARLQADALRLPLSDRGVEGVVQFRFLHHLPPSQAKLAVQEAARVARRYLVVTFFHPISVHGLRRRIGELLRRKARTRHTLWPGDLRRWLSDAGFVRTGISAQARYRRELWIAAFERKTLL